MKSLTPLEARFKQAYQDHPFLAKYSYITSKDLGLIEARTNLRFDDLKAIPFEENLGESEIFLEGENVAIIEHARYLLPMLHYHSFFEILYVREGECLHYMDNTSYPLVAGDIVIIAPNHRHALSAFSDEADIINLQIRTSTFEKTFLGILADKDVLSDFFIHCLYQMKEQTCLTFRTGSDPALKQLSAILAEEFRQNRKYRGRMMDSLISGFFVLLLRNHEKDVLLAPDSNSSRDGDFILLLQYIQNNYANLTLRDLAEFFNYSPRHISRLLKEHTGKNYAEITKELRMKKAGMLLKNQDYSIHAVMEIAGYTDVSTFYKAFRSYYGMSPAKYRKMICVKNKRQYDCEPGGL